MVLDETTIKNISHIPPLGIGYVKLITNTQGKADDYMFLSTNPAFTELTGWNEEDIVNKKASEIFANQESVRLYWLSFYIKAVESGKTYEMTQWMEVLKRYLTITVIPIDKIYFTITLRTADEESVFIVNNTKDSKTLETIEAVFNSTHDAVSLLEYKDGFYYYVKNNPMHQSLTGVYSIKGMELSQVVGYETEKRLRIYYQRCIRTGHPVSYEQEFDFAPGKRIWQTEVAPIFSEGGIRYLLLFSKDITELKAVQKEHDRLNRRLQAMFSQHSAIKLIFEPISGAIVYGNPAACKFYGYTEEEFLELKIDDIYSPISDNGKPQFGKELESQNYFSAVPYRIKNGEIRFLDIYSCPITDEGQTLFYLIIFDTTDRETFREELLKEKELLRTTLQSIGDGVVTTDNNGRITDINMAAIELTGWDRETAIGKLFEEVFILENETTGEVVENPVKKVLETGKIVGLANHTRLIGRDGHYISIADSAAPIKTEDGRTYGVVMVFRDVGEEKEHSRQIEFLSYHDPLTGLHNRYYMEEALQRLEGEEYLPLTVVMGDVNGLKITNDVFGHKAGDALLKSVAQLLEENARIGDTIARIGGDEFFILMPNTTLDTAEEILNRIKNTHISISESGLNLSISLGCSSKETMERSIQTVIREAEEYMYHQKLLDGKSYRNAIINTLLATLYEKSNETEEHSKRMERYCHSVGRILGLSSKEMDQLSLLALLHDIGKVGINQNILQKPGKLTSEEWDEMKRHPEMGYRIAQSTPELSVVSELILSHHERWDGNGYPHGLKGEEIPMVCRVLAVADAFDAMTSDRAYRKAMSVKEAVLELEGNAGTQFDPYITKVLIEEIRKDYVLDGKGD